MNNNRIIIKNISFIGNSRKPSRLDFDSGVNLIYGASNTGKSFLLKAIDFIFGGNDQLPDIPERIGYDYVLLGLTITNVGDFTLVRSTKGGNYSLYNGLLNELDDNAKATILTVSNPPKGMQSLSQFLLEKLGFAGKKLAKSVTGVTENISIRDFSTFFIVNETTIQSEKSVVEGDLGPLKTTRERSFFRLLLTGSDDSSIAQIPDKKTLATSKKAKIDILYDLLDVIEKRLEQDYSDQDDLPDQYKRLTNTITNGNEEYTEIEKVISEIYKEKSILENDLREIEINISESEQHISKFSQLDNIYNSDIERLKSIEEASNIVTLSMDRNCDLCGAPPEAQKFKKGIEEIEKSKNAVIAEIIKIGKLKEELNLAIKDLNEQKDFMISQASNMQNKLQALKTLYLDKQEKLNKVKSSMLESVNIREKVKEGISLIEQKNDINKRIRDTKSEKYSDNDRPKLKAPDNLIHILCMKVSEILKAWDFPGECDVSFDETEYDIKIDGKLRTNNGKGVRAITHSAFKIALLLLCEEQKLPYPGLLILDSPLVTYRDPIKNVKDGTLSEDEIALAKTDLKEKFFKFLSEKKHIGQFIILENVDPPNNIKNYAHVELFYGNSESGKKGFFNN